MHFHQHEAEQVAARDSRQRLRARIAVLQAQPDTVFVQDFPAVVAAVEAAFRREEALCERRGDAALHSRRADHAVVLRALHRTLAEIESGDVMLGRRVADALDAVLSLPCDAGTDTVAATPRRRRQGGRPRCSWEIT
ncbi:hypothetical protein [Massilia luteola]|uniref:hypothetical protein n=1 Tax=Massilia luteola TaxID=3081751 RepID=UPI002ACBFC39|nr:hypothetical protein [Massilia sp. Gc5]